PPGARCARSAAARRGGARPGPAGACRPAGGRRGGWLGGRLALPCGEPRNRPGPPHRGVPSLRPALSQDGGDPPPEIHALVGSGGAAAPGRLRSAHPEGVRTAPVPPRRGGVPRHARPTTRDSEEESPMKPRILNIEQVPVVERGHGERYACSIAPV